MGSWSFELQPAGFHGGDCVTTAGTKHLGVGLVAYEEFWGVEIELHESSIYRTIWILKNSKVPSLGMRLNWTFPGARCWGVQTESLIPRDTYALLPHTLLMLLYPKLSHINITVICLNMYFI
jgi:hypothetical protein